MTITKLDAAKSQLATAIRLYFEDCDPVSVHTLATAAGEMIDRLCASGGIRPVRSDFLGVIIPERRKEIGKRLNKARNFFKHANLEVLDDFSDELNVTAIVMAAEGLRRLEIELSEARIFATWVAVVEPHLVETPLVVPVDLDGLRDQPRGVQKEFGRQLLHAARLGSPLI